MFPNLAFLGLVLMGCGEQMGAYREDGAGELCYCSTCLLGMQCMDLAGRLMVPERVKDGAVKRPVVAASRKLAISRMREDVSMMDANVRSVPHSVRPLFPPLAHPSFLFQKPQTSALEAAVSPRTKLPELSAGGRERGRGNGGGCTDPCSQDTCQTSTS